MADDLDELKRRLRTYTKGWHPGVEEMREQAADALDRLTAEIANLRADLKVKQIATDEAMAQGERQQSEIEGLTEALHVVIGCFEAARIEGLDERLAEASADAETSQPGSLFDLIVRRLLFAEIKAQRTLSQSPADVLARREAERKVIEAAWKCMKAEWGTHYPDGGRHDEACELIDALAALAEQEAKGPHGG